MQTRGCGAFSCAGLGLVVSLAGCSAGAPQGAAMNPGNVVPAAVRPATTVPSPIKHVVIIVQENRSFDNIFAGFPGADTATIGRTHAGSVVPLRPMDFTSSTNDPDHDFTNGLAEWNQGHMNGFDLETHNGGLPLGNGAYTYLQRSLVAPYWAMAQQYVLADHMFPTEWGASFTAHLDLIAGTTLLSSQTAEADNPNEQPWDCDAAKGTATTTVSAARLVTPNAGPFPCFTQFTTMSTTLDRAGVSWKYYAPATSDNGGSLWTSFGAIRSVRYGPDWKYVINPETTVLTDAGGTGLPAVSWVIPDYVNSDHPGNGSGAGPSWVASVVNAIGKGPNWKSTAIVIVWDDWGGFYDNVSPPQLDFMGLGMRVPCIIVSPYAKAHYVSHTQYEFGSILKFVEQTFGLQSLGATDVRANSLADSFDFTRKPRAFTPISAPYPAARFLHEKPSLKEPDDE